MSRYWFSSANKECKPFQAVSWLSYYMFIRQCTIPNYHRVRHSMQEQPFMLAVVPSFLRYPGSASASQAPDVSTLSHLTPSSRVDLADKHILAHVSKSTLCVSECRCPVRVNRDGAGELPACAIKVIQNCLSRAGELRVEARIPWSLESMPICS